MLVVTSGAQPKIYNRDGKEQGQCIRGDVYIRDMKNTKGHVAGCTTGQWHPLHADTCLTASEDGTIRVWDTTTMLQKTVVKPALKRPARTPITAAAYAPRGTTIAAALLDGSLQLWEAAGKRLGTSAAIAQVLPPKAIMKKQQDWTVLGNPRHVVRPAHVPGHVITALAFSPDGNILASRAADASLKLWDVRAVKAPLHVLQGLPT